MKRSLLQLRILLELRDNPARNLTRLAETLQAQRPSVSRAVTTMKRSGLVERAASGWHLTPAGRREAAQLSRNMLRSLEESAKVAQKQWQEISKHLDWSTTMQDMDRAINSLTAVTSSQPLADIFDQLAVAKTFRVPTTILDVLSTSLPPLVDTQLLYSRMVPDLTLVGGAFSRILEENNRLLANAIASVQFVQLSAAELTGPVSGAMAAVAGSMASVSRTYREQIQEELAGLASLPESLKASAAWNSLTLPGVGVAGYAGAVAVTTRPEQAKRPERVPSTRYDRIQIELRSYLAGLRPEFVAMIDGGWQALEGDNPDRIRHAASSHRDLMRMVLAELVPTAERTEGEAGSEMKFRVRALISSKTSASFAGSLAQALYEYYAVMSRANHTWYEDEAAMEAAMVAGEATLLFIFAHMGDDNRPPD